jgi:hypothetical protein
LRPRSALLDVERGPGSLHCPGFSSTAGPSCWLTEVHSYMKPIPSKVSHRLLAAPPVGRVRLSLRSFDPFNGIFRSEPPVRRAVTLASVPLSGFFNLSAVSQQASEFVALFHATTVPGTSLQSVPLVESAHPSRGHYSPAVIYPRAGTHHSRTYHRWFPRRPRSHAVAWFPRRLWSPFPQTRLLASRFPWISCSEPALSASFTCFEVLLPLQVRSHQPGWPRTSGRYSPGFLPL